MKPLLVGEDNPYSADPRHALFPYPERSAGHRLATVILGMSRAQYLRDFDRVNLCAGKWSAREARLTAERLEESGQHCVFILLGRKVAAAFGFDETPPFTVFDTNQAPHFYLLPHPSGRARAWNEPGAIERARALLAPVLNPTGRTPPPVCKVCRFEAPAIILRAHRGHCGVECRDYDPDPGPHPGDGYDMEPPH